MGVRRGTRWKYNISTALTGDIIELIYFQNKVVIFTSTGEVGTVDSVGLITAIWNNTIASLEVGAPIGWTTTATISTTEFRNELVVMNGVDKPILIAADHDVGYLQDVATGSNIFTPIGRYCTTADNYVVIAGIAAAPDDIYISAVGTSGTFPGDPNPNDAISINIAAYTGKTGGEIRGVSSFRNMLVVHFATSSLFVVLGEYDADGNHKPRILDTIAEQGIISHRTQNVLDQDIVFADERAVYRARRNQLGTAIEQRKVSSRIQNDFVAAVPTTQADRWKSFSVHNSLEDRIMYFLFDGSNYTIYTLSFNEELKNRAWSQFTGWQFTSGCSTSKGRVYFGQGQDIFQLGNEVFDDEDFLTDFAEEPQTAWVTATHYYLGDKVQVGVDQYHCLVEHDSGAFPTDLTLGKWEEWIGDPIILDWEMPWTNMGTRMKKKRISYLMIETAGTADFTFEAYIDKIRYNADGGDDPALTLEMVAGDSPGFGGGAQPYGGGRRTSDERLWGFPLEFKTVKFRVTAAVTKKLKFNSMSFAIGGGTYKR
jgi:hypothetical protein